MTIRESIAALKGPISVLGGSGFVGRNLASMLREHRADVLSGSRSDLDAILAKNPKTVFNCIAYGTKPGEVDPLASYEVNFLQTAKILARLSPDAVFIHAGSSVEYGTNCSGPTEDSPLAPITPYAVSKAACADLLWYLGKTEGRACANLRLYSVYGKHQAENQLIQVVLRHGREGKFPSFVPREVSYDFIHVDDVCRAFILAAVSLPKAHYGESFNIGTGKAVAIGEVADTAKKLFGIAAEPAFTLPYPKTYFGKPWFANTKKAAEVLGFKAPLSFAEGLALVARA